MSQIKIILPSRGFLALAFTAAAVLYGTIYHNLRHELEPKPASDSQSVVTSATLPESAKLLRNWAVLRPISAGIYVPPASDSKGASAAMNRILDTVYLSNEGSLHPDSGASVTVNGSKIPWTLTAATLLNLDTVKDQDPEKHAPSSQINSVGYAVTSVTLPKAVKNATLYVGSDNAVAIWLNGKPIHRTPAVRASVLVTDTIPGLSLNAGKNTFVFKVAQGEGEWLLSAALDTSAE